jgi:hypothetical protein
MIAECWNMNVVLLSNLQNRLAFFGLYLFAVEFESNHLEVSLHIRPNCIVAYEKDQFVLSRHSISRLPHTITGITV